MYAQQLDTPVTLQRRATGQDDWGQPMEGWEDVAQVWADVRHLSGVESIKAGADVSVVRSSVRIRPIAGIDAGMRVLLNGQHYDIKAVLPGGRRGWVDLVCEVAA